MDIGSFRLLFKTRGHSFAGTLCIGRQSGRQAMKDMEGTAVRHDGREFGLSGRELGYYIGMEVTTTQK